MSESFAGTESRTGSNISSNARGAEISKLATATFGPVRPPLLQNWWRAALLVMLIVAGTLISLARTPTRHWSVLWAEDGPVFMSPALREHGPELLAQGYAGYLHLVPRIAAEFIALVPLEAVPVTVTIVSAFIASLTACACFVFMETRIAAVELRFAAWIACLALPIMGGEVVNNLANLHWYLLIAAFCAACAQSRSTGFVVLQSVVIFLAVASDALGLLLLPIMVLRWWVFLHRRDRLPTIAFAIAAAMQLFVVVGQLLLGAGRPVSSARPDAADLVDSYVFRVVLTGLFGTSGPARLLEFIGSALPGIVLAGVIATVATAAVLDPVRRVGIVAFAACSLLFALIVYTLQWEGFVEAPILDFTIGGRYAVVPIALLLLSLLQAADALAERVVDRLLRRAVTGAVLIAVIVPVVVDFRPVNIREGAPVWSDSLQEGLRDCRIGEDLVEDQAVVGTAPTWFGGMLVSCSVIEQVDEP